MAISDIDYTRVRLRKAEALADSLLYDDRLHELALNAVFAIEDRLSLLQDAAPSACATRATASVIRFPASPSARLPRRSNLRLSS